MASNGKECITKHGSTWLEITSQRMKAMLIKASAIYLRSDGNLNIWTMNVLLKHCMNLVCRQNTVLFVCVC